jgi:pimeloyl-ACP methyl ester carboxylesterase
MNFVQVKTDDGYHFKGLLSESEKKGDVAIVHIHGMSGDFYTNPYYSAMYTGYPKNGIAFLAGENRGTHSITQFKKGDAYVNTGNAFEKFEECVDDIQAWVDFAKKLGYKKIWLQSHSLGPSKVAYYMDKRKPKDVSGLVWLSPSDMIGLVHDPEGAADHKKMFPEAKKLVKAGKSSQVLSHKLWGEYVLSAGTYLNFFDKKSNTAIFNYGLPELGWDVVNSIKVPVLAFTGTKDDGIAPVMDAYKAMKLLKKELKQSPRVQTVVYKECEHSFEGFEKQIVSDVVSFMVEKSTE